MRADGLLGCQDIVRQRSYDNALVERSETKDRRRAESVLKVLESRFRGMRRRFRCSDSLPSRLLPLTSARYLRRAQPDDQRQSPCRCFVYMPHALVLHFSVVGL